MNPLSFQNLNEPTAIEPGNCFSIFEQLLIIVPPMIAIISPKTTYKIDIFIPKNPANNNSDATSTIGEDIKNENVTPRGNPALLKPINIGILEQEQNGVTVPKSAETIDNTNV